MRRSLSGPLVLSAALHAGLSLVLLSFRSPPPPIVHPHVITVELVELADIVDADGERDGGAPQPRTAETEPNTDEPLEELVAAEAAAAAPEDEPADEPVESPPADPPETSARSPDRDADEPLREPAAPISARERLEVITPPAAAAAQPEPPTGPASTAPEALTVPDMAEPTIPSLATLHPGTALEAARAAPAVSGAPEAPEAPAASATAPMADTQQRMLEDRLRSWAERFTDRPPEPLTEWEHDGQRYTASFTRLPAGDDMGLDEVLVEITTEVDGRLLSAESRMRRMAFSHFAQFIDRWDPSVQIHDDEIEGRFHSNSDIHVSQSFSARPTFHGRVTTSRNVNTAQSPRRVSRAEVFRGGLETRVRRIGLPRRASVTLPEEIEDRDDVLHVEADAHIVFHRDGTLTWRLTDDAAERHVRLPQDPFYVVGADRVSLHVRGTVRGKVLVYSPERIVIEGDLVYATDPERDADSPDYLGLVSEKNVEIAEPAVTGPGDLTIHASIYAKRRFNVRRYTARGDADARLDIYGSVSAGSLSATEPRYRSRIRFDPRFERARPPGFPVTDRYEMAAWDAEWTLAEQEDDRAILADDRASLERERQPTVN